MNAPTGSDEAATVAQLDNVLTRLAMTDDSKLERVLDKLLPQLVAQLGTAGPQARAKLLAVLSHVNKRVRSVESMRLPLTELVALYGRSASAPLVLNFAIVYIEMAFARATREDCAAVAAPLLEGVGCRSEQHKPILLRTAVDGLAALEKEGGAAASVDSVRADFTFLRSELDKATFMAFARDCMLYAPPSARAASALDAAQAAAQAGGSAAAVAARMPSERTAAAARAAAAGVPQFNAGAGFSAAPPGMSRERVDAVRGKTPVDTDIATRRKLALQWFLAKAGMPPAEVYPVALIGAEDSSGAVVTRAEEMLAKQCFSVDLDSHALVTELLRLHQGTGVGTPGAQQQGDPAAADPAFVNAASPGLKARIISTFVRSVAAANSYPRMLAVVFDGLFGADTTPRLKQLSMELVAWSFKHGSDSQLVPVAPVVLQGLLKQLDSGVGVGVSGNAADAPAVALRQFTYSALGQLCRRAPKLVASDAALASRLFRAAGEESAALVSSVADALLSLSIATKALDAKGGVSPELQRALLALIEGSATSAVRAARLAAAQWASDVFPFSHAGARRVAALCAGDDAMDVREEGLRGLTPPAKGDGSSTTWPSSGDMLRRALAANAALDMEAKQGEALLMPPKQYAAFVRFVRTCREREEAGQQLDMPEANKTAEVALSDRLYEQLLSHALVPAGDGELHALASGAILAHAGAGRGAEAADKAGVTWAPRVGWLQTFLGHTDRRARSAMAQMVGIAARGLSSADAAKLLANLAGRFSAKRFEDADGALRAAGFVMAQRRTRSAMDADEVKACEDTAAAMVGMLPMPKGDAAQECGVATSSSSPVPAELQATVALGLGYVGLTGPLPVGDTANIDAAVARVVLLLKAPEPAVVSHAATSLGFIAGGDSRVAVGEACVGAMFGQVLNKSESVQFAIGEALAFAFGGSQGCLPVPVEEVLGGEFASLAESPRFSEGVSPNADAEGGRADDTMDAEGGEHGAGAPEAGDRMHCVGVQKYVLDELFGKHVYDSRANARASGTVWLLSVIRFCGNDCAGAQEALPEAQEAFGQLLGDTHELTSEMASRGMSIVYQLGDPTTRARLVQDLVDNLTGKVKRNRRIKVAGDTEVFQSGSMGETPDGKGLSTYKELCSLASEMGKPDLVYKFMDLANHQASLKSARGAAFGAMGVAAQAGEALAPHLPKLFPKLYRMQYDPSPAVQDAMSGIIKSLVDDVRGAVDKYYAEVMAECISSISGRLWRSREAACCAAADALSGRPHELIAPHLEQLWTLSLRALDDIKETVRSAATTLARALASNTLRLVDPKLTKPDLCASTAASVFPIILEKGITSSAKEVSAFSVGFLIKLVEAAGEQCRPHIPDVAVCMLEAMSTMESATINYLSLHSQKYDIDTAKLEEARANANSGSPAHDALQLCVRFLDEESLAALVPRLTSLAGSGVGLPTRVGVAKLTQSLAARHASSVKPHAKTLCKAFISGADRESSAATRKAYYAAVAALTKLMSAKAIGKIVDNAVHAAERDEDGAVRSAQLLREISRGSPDALAPHLSAILPLAFLLKHSTVADPSRPGKTKQTPIGAAFADVWDENTASAASSLRLYQKECVGRVVEALQASSYERKREGARAAITLATELKGDVASNGAAAEVIPALVANVPGRIYEGKEEVLDAIGTVVSTSAKAMCAEGATVGNSGACEDAASSLVASLKRGQTKWREAATAALSSIVSAMSAEPACATRSKVLALCVPTLLQSASGALEGDDDGSSGGLPSEGSGKVMGAVGAKAEEEAARAVADARVATVSMRARRAAALRALCALLRDAGEAALVEAGATVEACAASAVSATADASAWEAQVAALELAVVMFEAPSSSSAAWAGDLLAACLSCADATANGSTSQAREAAMGALAACMGGMSVGDSTAADRARASIEKAAQHDGSGSVRAAALRALDR